MTQSLRDALERLVAECEQTNGRCVDQIGIGPIDQNAISAARAALQAAPQQEPDGYLYRYHWPLSDSVHTELTNRYWNGNYAFRVDPYWLTPPTSATGDSEFGPVTLGEPDKLDAVMVAALGKSTTLVGKGVPTSADAITPVYRICVAYDQGYTRGERYDDMRQPYAVGTPEAEAYEHGFKRAKETTTPQAVGAVRVAKISAALTVLQQDYSPECLEMASTREYVEDAVSQLIDAGYSPTAPHGEAQAGETPRTDSLLAQHALNDGNLYRNPDASDDDYDRLTNLQRDELENHARRLERELRDANERAEQKAAAHSDMAEMYRVEKERAEQMDRERMDQQYLAITRGEACERLSAQLAACEAKWNDTASALVGATTQLAAQQAQDAEDAALLDWLEAEINAHGAIHLHDGSHPSGRGLGLHHRTLREAIGTARQAAIDAALQAGGETEAQHDD